MTAFLIMALIVLVSFWYMREVFSLEKFRKNIHEGDTIMVDLGQEKILATVKNIPSQNLVIVMDLFTLQDHTVFTNCIYPI